MRQAWDGTRKRTVGRLIDGKAKESDWFSQEMEAVLSGDTSFVSENGRESGGLNTGKGVAVGRGPSRIGSATQTNSAGGRGGRTGKSPGRQNTAGGGGGGMGKPPAKSATPSYFCGNT